MQHRVQTGRVTELIQDEDVRATKLLEAQGMALQLFVAVEARGIVRPGVSERAASDEIRDLANAEFGMGRHWHKRIVRAGANTLNPYDDNPPDRLIGDDDIVFLDFGPIFEEWEADFGRTFVLGDDPVKHALRDALPVVWDSGRAFFDAHPDVTGEQLYAHVVAAAEDAGWEFGGDIAGHWVGQFPHQRIPANKIGTYVAPGSTQPMRRTDPVGLQCHWILEVHLVDRERQIGGFFEELLDVGPGRSA